jgi:hypothetical protein
MCITGNNSAIQISYLSDQAVHGEETWPPKKIAIVLTFIVDSLQISATTLAASNQSNS